MSMTVERTGCLNNTIKVAAGHYVDLAETDPATIDIKSIAAALSKICRFGGHCPAFYSVAEHCVHATVVACSEGFTGKALQAVLLHDAAEAYIGDMVKPLKVMMPEYQVVERRIEQAIQSAFDVDFQRWEYVIKRFDRAMLKAEKISMWPEDKEEWVGFSEIEECAVKLQLWGPSRAEAEFLGVAEILKLVG